MPCKNCICRLGGNKGNLSWSVFSGNPCLFLKQLVLKSVYVFVSWCGKFDVSDGLFFKYRNNSLSCNWVLVMGVGKVAYVTKSMVLLWMFVEMPTTNRWGYVLCYSLYLVIIVMFLSPTILVALLKLINCNINHTRNFNVRILKSFVLWGITPLF
jgi:hypothetical protein